MKNLFRARVFWLASFFENPADYGDGIQPVLPAEMKSAPAAAT